MAAAFRLFSELDTFYGQSGQLLAGGYLTFCEAGTTTPKDVYGEEALSTNNGSTVALDSSGRPSVDVWGSGAYFVEVFDADDVKQGEADDVQIPGGEATALPTLSADKFLTNDGSTMQWADVRQVPDPSGNANKVLGTDGTDLIWQELSDPTVPDPEIVVSASSCRVGVSTDDTKWLTQTGTGSAAASSSKTTSASVTFSTAYSVAPFVSIAVTTASACATANVIPSWAVTSVSTTGFTVTFSTLTGGTSADDYPGSTIINAVTFGWKAEGTKEVSA